MVKRALGVLLSLALLVQPGLAADLSVTAATSPTAQALSPSAEGLLDLPGRPAPIPKVPNRPVEDFFAVTLLSLPFTALWALVGALVVGGIAQNHFPPEFDTPLLTAAGMAAAGTSVAIGLVSVQWSAGPAPSPTPALTPVPQP